MLWETNIFGGQKSFDLQIFNQRARSLHCCKRYAGEDYIIISYYYRLYNLCELVPALTHLSLVVLSLEIQFMLMKQHCQQTSQNATESSGVEKQYYRDYSSSMCN